MMKKDFFIIFVYIRSWWTCFWKGLTYTLPGAVYKKRLKNYGQVCCCNYGVEDLLKAAGTASQILIQGSDYDPNYKTGLYAGENKIGVMLKRQIPIYRSFDQGQDKLEKNQQYAKLNLIIY